MTTSFTLDDCRLADFRTLVKQPTDPAEYPHAASIESNVPIYENIAGTPEAAAEVATALLDGPGIAVFRGAFAPSVVDRATGVFFDLIAAKQAVGAGGGGDHFAKPGANDRVWGALDKFAVRDPDGFAAYYDNDVLALVARAWLGAGYQVTSQVNVVNPGGQAQIAHRDYHLGFMSPEQAMRYPAPVHRLSPALTLQGAVAHVDMPVETGPTCYLPYSQQYEPGYLAVHRPEFTAYFDEHHVQLPLRKGDAVFFNPALFHGAGTNRSAGVRRMANLLQISSAFGRAMETVDRTAMCLALYPTLSDFDGDADNVIAASAEGYAFPTNLDRDQPIGGLAPQTQADLLRQALSEKWAFVDFAAAIHAQQQRRLTRQSPSTEPRDGTPGTGTPGPGL